MPACRHRGAADKKQGVTYRSPSGTTLRLLLDENNVGPEVSVGEITFPPNLDSGDHKHGSIEMFYVVSGELEHVVNGKSEILKPGMAGYVNPRHGAPQDGRGRREGGRNLGAG